MFSYRIYRLRRLILLAAALPILGAFLTFGAQHPWFPALVAISVLLPVAHVLRYPSVWLETMSVSFTWLGMILLLGLMDTPQSASGLFGAALALALLGFLLFLAACVLPSLLICIPATCTVNWHASGRSTLAPADMLRRMNLTEDPYWTLEETDQEGLFKMTFAREIASFEEDENGDPKVDVCTGDMFMKVLSDTDRVYEYITFETADGPLTTVRHEIEEAGEGSRLTVLERTQMQVVMAFGYWLTDSQADYLVDQIALAEGRPRVSIRAVEVNQLIVDIARLFPQPAAQ